MTGASWDYTSIAIRKFFWNAWSSELISATLADFCFSQSGCTPRTSSRREAAQTPLRVIGFKSIGEGYCKLPNVQSSMKLTISE